jgi:hypothetical protein
LEEEGNDDVYGRYVGKKECFIEKMNKKIIFLFMISCISPLLSVLSSNTSSAIHPPAPHHSSPSLPIPTAVIHVGPYKTGSTSFQNFLFHSHKYFANQSYYFIGNCTKAHRIITEKLKGFHESDAFQQKLGYQDCSISFRELNHFLIHHLHSQHNVIFSAEDFSSLDSTEIIRLQEMLNGYKVKIILVYRQWINFVYSYFNQQAKSFHAIPFFEYFLSQDHSPHAPSSPNSAPRADPLLLSSFYDRLIANYKATFRPENVFVIDYYGMMSRKKEVIEVIVCEILSICSPGLKKSLASRSSSFPFASTASAHLITSPRPLLRDPNAPVFYLNHAEILYHLQYLDSFNQYLRLYHSCRLKYHSYFYLNSSHTHLTYLLWHNLSLESLPLVNRSNPHLIQQSLDQDQHIRSGHSDVHWLYPDPAANKLQAIQFSYREVSTMSLLGSRFYSQIFRDLKEDFETKGVLVCQQRQKHRHGG